MNVCNTCGGPYCKTLPGQRQCATCLRRAIRDDPIVERLDPFTAGAISGILFTAAVCGLYLLLV